MMTRPTVHRWLYLPIDIKTREIHGKTLLAALATQRGYNVVIGKKSDVAALAYKLPKGAFIGFGVHQNFSKKYRELQSLGHKVVTLDEEGLLTFSESMFQRFRMSKETVPYVNIALAWGKHHADMMRNFARENNLNLPISVSGNPRLDILSAKYRALLDEDVHKIKKAHNKILLFVSSFASCNHLKGREEYTNDLITKKVIQSDDDYRFYQSYFDLKKDNFDFFCESIRAVAEAYPDYQVIIRPHPSENEAIWNAVAATHTNIKICKDGSIHPWIIAADAIIHHFCTTAIEAYVCGTPSISVRVRQDKKIETDLPYNCSYTAKSKDELLSALSDIINNSAAVLKRIRNQHTNFYKSYIGNTDAIACDHILNVLDSILTPVTKHDTLLCLTIFTERFADFLRNIVKSKDKYTHHKFDTLTKDEMDILIAKLSSIDTNITNIRVTPVTTSSCLMTRE